MQNEKRIKFQTVEEMTSCFFYDSLSKEEKKKIEKYKTYNLFYYSLALFFMLQEIENTKQSTEKMTLFSESSGNICIDVIEMKYVEGSSESNCK